MLTVLDEYTREALSAAVRSKMSANDVLDTFHPLFIKHGKPEFIRSVNGPEFVAAQLLEWLQRVYIKSIHIYPGSPWKNGYNERFNGTLRQEVLNAEGSTARKTHRLPAIRGSNNITVSDRIRL